MKYVLLKHPRSHQPRILLGLVPQTHAEMAAPAQSEGFAVVSAGFLRFEAMGRIVCFGESQSLRAVSHPDDARVIDAFYRATLSTAIEAAPRSPAFPAPQHFQPQPV